MSDIIIPYDQKPEMIFFDFGGTLFVDGRCCPADGFAALLQAAENPDVTDKDALARFGTNISKTRNRSTAKGERISRSRSPRC